MKNELLHFFLLLFLDFYHFRIIRSRSLFVPFSCRNVCQFNAILDASADFARGIRKRGFHEEPDESFGRSAKRENLHLPPRARATLPYIGMRFFSHDRSRSPGLYYFINRPAERSGEILSCEGGERLYFTRELKRSRIYEGCHVERTYTQDRREPQIQSRHSRWIINPPVSSETTDFSVMKQTAFFHSHLGPSSWYLVALGHSIRLHLCTCIYMYTRTALPKFTRRNGCSRKKGNGENRKKDTAVLIDRARFVATRRDSIVCSGEILGVSEPSR